MNFSFQQLALKKRYPLRISRGETTGSVNLFISVESGGVVGLGEAAPDATADIGTAASCQREIEAFLEANGPVTLNPYDAWQVARDAGLSSYSWAAVDIALGFACSSGRVATFSFARITFEGGANIGHDWHCTDRGRA